ncbi:hypothetical protein QTI33_23570 [Variovorax sp. J22P271]|uniref:hypothetical protein n=1 Tax=Variovorax davisae TaxID=3053515 RepID=UPI002575FE33|nr:hypothetical protein [Variovorax sp. J22P271]MDM0035134.1 hypothetical protein [Variovorax sp. J22P271]
MTDITLPMTRTADLAPAGHARRVIAQTASAWNIAPASPLALARRVPRGHVPIRTLRRMRAAVAEAAANEARLEDALTQGLRWAI